MAEAKLDVVEVEGNTPLDMEANLTAANADGNYWLLKGTNALIIKNASGATITVTLKMVGESNTGQVDDVEVEVPTLKTYICNPSDHWRFADTVGSYLHVEYDDVTTLTVGLFRLPYASR
jgi:hypothetical protein